MGRYHIFGLPVESDLEINASLTDENPEVYIYFDKSLDADKQPDYENWIDTTPNETFVHVKGIAEFSVKNGNEIRISCVPSANEEYVKGFLFGVCFSYLLQQRGILVIHGSCIYKNGKTVLVCGMSGAGKSTVASRFLKDGWELMSDDVVPVINENGKYYVQSTFPCQKMWEDTVEINGSSENIISDIYTFENRTKFQIDASSYFKYDCLPLDYVVMLTVGSDELILKEVEGFSKVDFLMRNCFIKINVPSKEYRTFQLQTCIGLSSQIKMFLSERPKEGNTLDDIYEYLISNIEGKYDT